MLRSPTGWADRLLAGALCLAAGPALLWAPAAAAQETQDDKDQLAREKFLQAERHYNLAEYREALALYREAYLLSGRSELLFNIAQSYRQVGEKAEALKFYKNFLRLVPSSSLRGVAEEHITALEAALGRPDPPASRPASAPSGQPLGPVSQPASAPRTMPASAPGGGALLPAEGEPAPGPRWVAPALFGLGGAAALGGLGVGGAAVQRGRASVSLFDDGDLDGAQGALAARDSLARVSTALVLGGAVVIAGGVLWRLLREAP